MEFLVSDEIRQAPDALWHRLDGPKPPNPERFPSDGCSWSPDAIGNCLFWLAGVIHDWHYRTGAFGGNWAGRRRADLTIYRNVYRVARYAGRDPARATAWAMVYLVGVRIGGAKAYLFAEGEGSLSWWDRIREVAGLFRTNPPVWSE